jgi:hypothetical protein
MMADKTIETIERLEELAAWHRVIVERACSAWVWEARLLAAEDRERRAAAARARLLFSEKNIGGRDALRAETNDAVRHSSYGNGQHARSKRGR